MTKKYKINADGRVVALRDFGDVKVGDVGGFVESETNLSHEGDCWIYENAQVFGDAEVSGNARVYGDAEVSGNAQVYENAWVLGNAWVYGNARVYGNAQVSGNAQVYENAWVLGNAWVTGNAQVFGDAWVYGNAQVRGNAQVCENARVYGAMRSDGFCFCYVPCEDGKHRVIAGCRYFTMPEAREHWGTKHPKHKETCVILDALESLSKIRAEGCV